jgi:hypothetical protein
MIGKNLPEQDAERRAFPGAIVPEQSDDFASLHFERETMQSRPAGKRLPQITQGDH